MLFDRRSRRLRRTARRFKKKTIDYSKYIKDFYIEKGVAFISCNVKGYYDIIDEHSVPEYEWLNHSFARFVEENAYYIPNTYPIVLEICGTHFSEAQQQRITETILDYYALQLGDKQLDLDMNLKKSVILLLMGSDVLSIQKTAVETPFLDYGKPKEESQCGNEQTGW